MKHDLRIMGKEAVKE